MKAAAPTTRAFAQSARLIEVTVPVDGEAAEAVCDLFDRHGGGAVIEIVAPRDELEAPLALVRTYLASDDVAGRTRVEEGLWHLSRIYPMAEPAVRVLAQANWAEAWKEHYRPLRVGRRCLIVPSWLEAPAQAGDVVIRLDPGMAFGTGLHPTTRLCLAAVERLLAPDYGLLDVGTGSGILAIGGALLGAAPVAACDIDPQAIGVAAANAAANGVALQLTAGGVTEVPAGQFALVVANILAAPLCAMAPDLVARVAPAGRLLLSGVLDEQAAEVSAAYSAAGLRPVGSVAEKDWVVLEFAIS